MVSILDSIMFFAQVLIIGLVFSLISLSVCIKGYKILKTRRKPKLVLIKNEN